MTDLLAAVGPRLRSVRHQHDRSLAELSRQSGISVSTLSRLESGLRRPTLELLFPLAQAYQLTLDELIAEPDAPDPRVVTTTRLCDGVTIEPLSNHASGLQAFKMSVSATHTVPELRSHPGYEWVYVLSGRLRMMVGRHDLVLEPGQAAELDTRFPHWFGSTGEGPVEVLSLFGPQGERVHLRARTRRPDDPPASR